LQVKADVMARGEAAKRLSRSFVVRRRAAAKR
jgi:hypothetical protein